MRCDRRHRGFTLYEATIAIGITALLTATISQVFSSNHELAADTRAQQGVDHALRTNMAALDRVLRGIDIQSLDGFDAEGVSTNPHFARVTGADSGDFTYAGDEQLAWMPYPIRVNGVDQPGAVYLVRDGVRRLVADRVPAGGFFVRQQGQSLVVHLTTFYATSAGRTVERTSETLVSVRN